MGYSKYMKRSSNGQFRKGYAPLVKAGLGLALKGAAYLGKKFATKKARSFTKSATAAVLGPAKRTRKKFATGATYRGRFTNRRFPRQRAGTAAKGENYYATHGVTDTMEISGIVSDPNCVYLGHSSFSSTRLLESAIMSILRKLYIAGISIDFDSISGTIDYANGSSAGHTLTVDWRNRDGTAGDFVWSVPAGQSMYNIATGAVGAVFKGACELDRQLTRIKLSDNGTNITRASLDLTKTTIEYYAKSEMKIQNVTISNTASDEADDVNNVPLVGRNYEFKNWYPTTNSASNSMLVNSVNQFLGLTLARSFELPIAFSEPPPSAVFTGCIKSEKTRLQPGNIKSDWLIDRGSMSLDRFLQALDFEDQFTVLTRTRKPKIGRHSMMALEKVISISGTLPIKVFYEVNHFVGVAAKCGLSHAALGTTYTVYVNNEVPV